MESKKGITLSGFLICIAMLLSGFEVGLNIGSQLFTERPDFINTIGIVVLVLCGIIIPYVRKKEKMKGSI